VLLNEMHFNVLEGQSLGGKHCSSPSDFVGCSNWISFSMDYNAVEHAESMDSSLSKASSYSVEPAESLDILLVILLAVFVCVSTFVILSIRFVIMPVSNIFCVSFETFKKRLIKE